MVAIFLLKRFKRWLHPVAADPRSKRFVAVIECILNQNARDVGAACSPAMDSRLLQLCDSHRVGIVQMPCPEIHALGFARERKPGQSLRESLNDDRGSGRCRSLALDIAERIEAYLNQGYQLVAVLGGNSESPGCAVHHGPLGLDERSGLLMKQLQAELRQRGHDPPFLSMRDHDSVLHQNDLDSFERLLGSVRNETARTGRQQLGAQGTNS